MIFHPRMLLRMARLSRRRPSRRLAVTLGVTAVLIVVIYGIEHLFGWPAGLKVHGLARHLLR